jgi:pimeloyl-ACP methyl ester carboxylesterase
MPSPKHLKPLSTKSHLRPSDGLAASQLAVDATLAVTHIVEGVHHSVLKTIGLDAPADDLARHPKSTRGSTRGLTGLVYRSIREITQWIGGAVQSAYAISEPLWIDKERLAAGQQDSFERAAVVAALNGVVGDRLAASGNGLATPMSLRFEGPARSKTLLLVIHGLCMNDLQWTVRRNGQAVNLARSLAKAKGMRVAYLRYNTGLAVAENGKLLAQQLRDLMGSSGIRLSEINVLAHSMGGLVLRSALQHEKRAQVSSSVKSWPALMKRVVFLGTPHRGAPLETAGTWIDLLLSSTSYSAPLLRLTRMRSVGINDLRTGAKLSLGYGDAGNETQFYQIAACLAGQRSAVADRLVGDGLVPLNSALDRAQGESPSSTSKGKLSKIFYRMNHMELLWRDEVSSQLSKWFEAT